MRRASVNVNVWKEASWNGLLNVVNTQETLEIGVHNGVAVFQEEKRGGKAGGPRYHDDKLKRCRCRCKERTDELLQGTEVFA